MAKLIWTEESLSCLKSVGDYLGDRSPRAAVTVVEGIYKKSQILIKHPQIGSRFTDIADREVRTLLYGHYRVVYEVHDADVVTILAIVHSAMDIDQMEF